MHITLGFSIAMLDYHFVSGTQGTNPMLRIGPRQFASAARVRHSSKQKKPQSPAAHILQNWPEDLGEATGWLMIPVSLKGPENHGFLGNNAQAVSERKGIHFGHGKCFTFHGAGSLFQWRNHKGQVPDFV